MKKFSQKAKNFSEIKLTSGKKPATDVYKAKRTEDRKRVKTSPLTGSETLGADDYS